MNYQGRIVGIIIGTLVAGPIGAIIGYAIGSAFDNRAAQGPRQSRAQVQQAFFNATFLFMGYLAKSDGRVSQREIAVTEAIMSQLRLSKTEKEAARELFRRGRDQDFSYHTTLTDIAPHRFTRQMHTFISALINIANADGTANPSQQAALDGICDQLGLPRSNFFNFGGGQRQQGYRQQQRSQGSNFNKNPYQVLGIEPTAKTAEVRKKYRRLMSKNHPDKLAAKGASEEEIRQATEKTQEIRTAYELILEQRGEGKS